jgi:hypothetical protein
MRAEQKMQLARGWVTLGKRLWAVSIDMRDGAEIDHTLVRAGEKSQEDLRREMGNMM